MLENLIRWSIHHRLVVLLIALASVGLGSYVAVRLPVDVFPELSAPTVTLLTEAHSMAPEEVEILVTFPIETALNGAPGVRRVRSASGIGISVVWVEFDWGTDIYKARQIVSEKLQLVANGLPPGIQSPVMAPISSVMGEIILIGLTGPAEKLMELRTLADWVVRRHLLAVSGVSQVVPIGGQVRQFQVQLDSEEMRHRGVSLNEVLRAVEASSVNSAGGFFTESGKEFLVRGVGRVTKIQELGETPIKTREGVPVVLAQVGEVRIGAKVRRGTASVDAQEAVILSVQKQPQANTLELTGRIDEVLTEIEVGLPSGIGIERNIFHQSDFIETAIANVIEALRDGAILVVAVLFLFLMNFRTTLVSALAIPLSLIVTLLVLWLWGTSINTMTLGGMAIAVGALVDDAIIDVENVFRRLRQNRERPPEGRLSPVQIIFEACTEVRYPILFATFIVTVVFVPLFALSGLEGRMLIPLGVSYIVSIFASLLVALTVTPALCTYLLSNSTYGGNVDSWIVRRLKASYAPALRFSIEHQYGVMGLCAGLVLATLLLIPQMGRSFLPEFNEGTLTINMVTLPGTALERFDELGRLAEEIILSNPEITSTSRRTGRAELDEHAQEVNAAEIDVRFQLKDRSREVFLASLRNQLLAIPGTNFNIGQPISHRLDHMLSGTRAAIAIKLFGPDLLRLRAFGEQIRAAVESVAGVVDLQVEQQAHVPQVQLHYDRKAIGRSGLTISDVSLVVDAGLNGAVVGQIVEDQRAFDLLVRFNEKSRSSLAQIQQATIPNGGTAVVPLKQLADIRVDAGPNLISRENVQRKIVIQANVAGRDLGSTVDDMRAAIAENVSLPADYHVVYGGQFESEEEASRIIGLLTLVAILAVFVILYLAFGNIKLATLIMVNLPLALIGGVGAVFAGGGPLSIASMVGFITLIGIATRTGILMVSHYETLIKEGKPLKEAIFQGSMERLSPIVMTALTTGLALLPLAAAGGRPGNEIQSPLALVVLGGLLTSTFLNMVAVPALSVRFYRPRPAYSNRANLQRVSSSPGRMS